MSLRNGGFSLWHSSKGAPVVGVVEIYRYTCYHLDFSIIFKKQKNTFIVEEIDYFYGEHLSVAVVHLDRKIVMFFMGIRTTEPTKMTWGYYKNIHNIYLYQVRDPELILEVINKIFIRSTKIDIGS